MHVRCPRCHGRMYVPDEYGDRLVKCERCRAMYVPNRAVEQKSDGVRRAVPGGNGQGDAPLEFLGIRTAPGVMHALCDDAKARGNEARLNFLSAYANAQRALKRDTWQAASFEWQTAHSLLKHIHKERARETVAQTQREFRELASRQLLSFVRQMQDEFIQETAHLPTVAKKHRLPRVAKAFQNLVREDYRPLVNSDAVSQVERVAEQWATSAKTGA